MQTGTTGQRIVRTYYANGMNKAVWDHVCGGERMLTHTNYDATGQ